MTVPKDQALIKLEPDEVTSQIRNRRESTERGLRLLNPRALDEDEMIEKYKSNPRQRYAAMAAHKEMSAQVLAVGGTQKMAARYAGVSPRQIKKYLTDPDFRQRVEEMRETLAGKIKGKILREFNRRVTGTEIRQMEIMDLSRILDRVTTGGKGMAINVSGDVHVGNRYEAILAQLFDPNSGEKGEDFQVYEAGSFSVPGRDSPE
jgi:hypothetical protein